MSWNLIRSGVGLLRAGHTQEALKTLQQAAQAMPHDPRALLQLALAQLEAAQPDQALLSLKSAVEMKPDLAPAFYYQTLAHLDLEQLEEAQKSLDALSELSPENQALPTLRALLCLKRGEIEQVLLHLEIPPAPASSPWARPELSSYGPLTSRLACELEQWLLPLEIPRLYNSQALTDPPPPPILPPAQGDRVRSSLFGMLSGALVGAGVGLALRAFMRVMVGVDLDDTIGWLEPTVGMSSLFGLCGALWGFWKSTLPQQAQAYFQQKRGYALLEKALHSDSQNQRKQYFMLAIQCMRRVIELDPSLLRSHYCLGESLLFAAGSLRDPDLGDRFLAEAETCFLLSWEQDGENPYLNYYLARCCQLRGRIDAAITYYNRAIERFSKLSEGHYGLAQCHLLKGDRSEARRWFSRALGSELQLARDRLQDLGHYYSDGLLSKRPSIPAMPEPEIVVESISQAPAEIEAETAPPAAELDEALSLETPDIDQKPLL